MKEINEAYNQIMKGDKGHAGNYGQGGYGSYGSYGGYGGYGSYGGYGGLWRPGAGRVLSDDRRPQLHQLRLLPGGGQRAGGHPPPGSGAPDGITTPPRPTPAWATAPRP